MMNSKFSSCSGTQEDGGGGEEFSSHATGTPAPVLSAERPLGSGRPGGAGGV